MGAFRIERLPNYDKLVHPAWLRQLTEGGRPETYRGNDYLLFHVNFGAPEKYEESHLPGALHLDTNRLEDPTPTGTGDPSMSCAPTCSRLASRPTRR